MDPCSFERSPRKPYSEQLQDKIEQLIKNRKDFISKTAWIENVHKLFFLHKDDERRILQIAEIHSSLDGVIDLKWNELDSTIRDKHQSTIQGAIQAFAVTKDEHREFLAIFAKYRTRESPLVKDFIKNIKDKIKSVKTSSQWLNQFNVIIHTSILERNGWRNQMNLDEALKHLKSTSKFRKDIDHKRKSVETKTGHLDTILTEFGDLITQMDSEMKKSTEYLKKPEEILKKLDAARNKLFETVHGQLCSCKSE